MAGLYVKDLGVWKLPKSVWIKAGSVWRVCSNVYVKHNGSWREMMKTVTISGSQTNFNLYNYVGRPSQPLNLIVTIPANVTIFSSDQQLTYNIPPRTTAFTVGAFPAGSTVIINNNGYISGGGGFGGSGAGKQSNGPNYTSITGAKGGDGSYGIIKGGSGYTCTIVNTGTIAGGGGGGGGAGRIDGGGISTSYITGADGGYAAGITGYSNRIGQLGTKSPSFNQNVSGNGGNCGQNGTAGGGYGSTAYGGGPGGTGRPAIGSGIEIAVSGTILGGIG